MGSFTGTQLINDVARRLRDNSNTGYPRAMVLRSMNAVQSLINVRLGLLQGTTTLTTENRALYTVPVTTPRILTIRETTNGHEIANVPWDQLVTQDENWIRTYGERVQLWSQIGRDLLAIYPIPTDPTSLTITYVTYPAAITDAAVAWSLPDEYKPVLTDLTEAVMLFRSREFNAMQEAITRAAPRLGLEDAAQVMRRGTAGRSN